MSTGYIALSPHEWSQQGHTRLIPGLPLEASDDKVDSPTAKTRRRLCAFNLQVSSETLAGSGIDRRACVVIWFSYCSIYVSLAFCRKDSIDIRHCDLLRLSIYHVPNSVKSLELCPTMKVYSPVIIILQF